MVARNRRVLSLLMALTMLASAGFVTLAAPVGAQEGTTLALLGETHGTRDLTKQLVAQATSRGATGCVCLGDFIYGHDGATPQGWRDMVRPFDGRMLPAQGNHDWPWSDWNSLFPGEKPYYTTTVDGVRFISLNLEQAPLSAGSTQRLWLEETLAAEPADALKVVFLHRPWWLPEGARHPASEFEQKAGTSAGAMDALMVKHGVDLVIAGHEKNYQHSAREGVHYLISGGTGASWDKYGMGYALPGAIKRLGTPVASVLRVSADALGVESFDERGGHVESFTLRGGSGGAPPAPPGDYAPTFTPHGGNEWWVQTRVSPAAATVDARVDGGAWSALTLRSWGSWAATMRAPQGSMVEFRATDASGASATSGRYVWPEGITAPEAVPPSTFTATFTPSGGNEWWVQTRVDANGPVSSVEAKIDGGAWRALTLRSWGAWAATLHAPAGSTVQFRATGADGASAQSGAYAWPDATQAGAPAFAARFTPHGGNAWWVQTKVSADAPLAKVEARANGGAWHDLTLRSWGSWAASFNAPEGARVEFRATSTSGATVTSGAYAWPVK